MVHRPSAGLCGYAIRFVSHPRFSFLIATRGFICLVYITFVIWIQKMQNFPPICLLTFLPYPSLLQPKVDKDSLESLSIECPRIIVNPKPSPLGFRGIEVPRGALQDVPMDDFIVQNIDPKTWAVSGFTPQAAPWTLSSPNELTMAEKFRLAFVERDNRLAPKRAKNARQHQRRAEKEFLMTSTSAKAIALASRATKSLHHRS